jgi:hypothetical protein
MESCGSVVHDEFEHATMALSEKLRAHPDDFSANGSGLSNFQLPNWNKGSAIFITPWATEEEVPDGKNFQPCQEGRALGAHSGQGRDRGIERAFRNCG